MDHRKLARFSVALIFALFVAGCGSGGGSNKSDDSNEASESQGDQDGGGSVDGDDSSAQTISSPDDVIASTGNLQNRIYFSQVSGAVSYNLYWSKTAGVSKATAEKITNVSSTYTHNGVGRASTYYYAVTAVDAGGAESELSIEVSVTEGMLDRIDFQSDAFRSCVLDTGNSIILELTTLSCDGRNIEGLSGVKHLVAVTTLNLPNNKIIDISEISEITGIKVLDLSGNKITSGVSSLTNLTAPASILLPQNVGISCGELNQIIGAFGASVVNPSTATDGVNCTAP